MMSIIADRLRDDVLRDYPRRPLGTWTANAASVFLQDARAEDARGIGWLLSWAPYIEKSAPASPFRSYLDQMPSTTHDERQLLSAVVAALEGHRLPGDIRSVLEDRFGPKPP